MKDMFCVYFLILINEKSVFLTLVKRDETEVKQCAS